LAMARIESTDKVSPEGAEVIVSVFLGLHECRVANNTVATNKKGFMIIKVWLCKLVQI
jgi:hypothetical protein